MSCLLSLFCSRYVLSACEGPFLGLCPSERQLNKATQRAAIINFCIPEIGEGLVLDSEE